MKIVIAEKISPTAIQLLKAEPGWTVITAEQMDGNLTGALADADALIVRSAVDVNAEILRGKSKLRVIGRAGVGVDNIDLEAATKAGIAVMNTPGANAVAVAEQTLALMLAVAREHGIELAELDQVYSAADYLTLHVGLTAQTTGMINEKSLARMKRGVRIINCARGELVDEAALAAALKSNHVAGIALDVFTQEPPRNLPLLWVGNWIVTPHTPGS